MTFCHYTFLSSDHILVGMVVASQGFMKAISFFVILVLAMMMICPSVIASPAKASKSHCGTEGPAVPQQKETMQCCCDQSAIPVQELHPPFASLVLLTLSPQREGVTPIIFAFDLDNLPYLKTSDKLTKLSTLRL
jgi:hypothetical protein